MTRTRLALLAPLAVFAFVLSACQPPPPTGVGIATAAEAGSIHRYDVDRGLLYVKDMARPAMFLNSGTRCYAASGQAMGCNQLVSSAGSKVQVTWDLLNFEGDYRVTEVRLVK